MNTGYPNQPPYPGVAFPALQPPAPLPDKPGRPWPLGAVNRWMTIGIVVITLLAAAQAILASQIVTRPPATTGMTLAYQSSLTQNSSGQLSWQESSECQFSSTGYVATAPDFSNPAICMLLGGTYQDFTLRVTVVDASDIAVISFFGDNDRLEIFGTGRYYFYRPADILTSIQASQTRTGLGSTAIHPTSLGASDRVNEITIQVVGTTYSFYANGQLLTTYTASALENPGPISLGAAGGQQAEFSNIALYTPR